MWALLTMALGIGFAHDLRVARHRFHLEGLVQIHHVYPRQFRNHPSLSGFDVESAENLMLMPTRRGADCMRLRGDRLIHDGGHLGYNRFVGRYLDCLLLIPPHAREARLLRTLDLLRNEMRRHTFVPWDG